MEYTFRLIIEYDGTEFHGWQIQPAHKTIQEEIQKILSYMTGSFVRVIGSGRTDAGVHAIGQVAHFTCGTKITPEKFHDALNKMLPEGIVIRSCTYADPEFHARFSAIRKTYRYKILNRTIPEAIGRHYAWHIRHPLDIEAMQSAANHLPGKKDFKSFEGTGSPRSSTVRIIEKAVFSRDDDYIVFEITANGFLKFMVRNIVGTLVDVGSGKTTPETFESIIQAKDRNLAGATAPPQGLFLVRVEYPDTGVE